MQILDYLSVCHLSAFYEFLFLHWSFVPIRIHLHSQPGGLLICLGLCLMLDWMKKEQFYNLDMCLVWNLCPENPQQESYLSHLSSRQLLADFCSDFLRVCWDIFIQLWSTIKMVLLTLWDRRGLEESLFASKINCFLATSHRCMLVFGLKAWPTLWPHAISAVPERNACPDASHSVMLSSTENSSKNNRV